MQVIRLTWDDVHRLRAVASSRVHPRPPLVNLCRRLIKRLDERRLIVTSQDTSQLLHLLLDREDVP